MIILYLKSFFAQMFFWIGVLISIYCFTNNWFYAISSYIFVCSIMAVWPAIREGKREIK